MATATTETEKKDRVRPKDKEDRDGIYWRKWSPEKIDQLVEELGDIPYKYFTPEEKDLVMSDKMARGGGQVATAMMVDALKNRRLDQKMIDQLARTKIGAIRNKSNKRVEIDLPPESGARTLLSPPGGFMPISAYGETFISRPALEAHGLELVDYDPRNEKMNPPEVTASNLPTVDVRKLEQHERDLDKAISEDDKMLKVKGEFVLTELSRQMKGRDPNKRGGE